MYILITYDVDTVSETGQKRLRQVAKACKDYGQRVQNSVFECLFDASQAKRLQSELLELIDLNKDSLRFYYLGNKYNTKIEQFGINSGYNPQSPLII